MINSRPLTTDTLNDPMSSEPLTPNHLITMKSKVLLPPPGNFESSDVYSRKRWRRVQYMANVFWSRWRKEYLQSLQTRQKWSLPSRNIEVNDIVIVKDNDVPRNEWPLARVVDVVKDDDKLVRKVKVALSAPIDDNGKRKGKVTILERPIHKVIVLVENQDM